MSPSAGRVIAIVGATCVGKTAIGEIVADEVGGEVVCADSRQVFRELEIGTGKPDPATRAATPHHLFEALTLEERASAGWFARSAAAASAVVRARGRVPVLVGGSGLYLRALREGLADVPPEVPEIRSRLRAEAEALGAAELHRRLAEVDPESAARVSANDAQRVTRALEVWESTGQPLSWWHAQPTSPALAGDWRVVEITASVETLVERIARRTRQMFEGGLVEETRALAAAGRGDALRTLRAIGYDESLALLAGEIDREEAMRRVDVRTTQLAKRQRTWFRHQLEAARVDAEGKDARALAGATLEALAEAPPG